MLRDEVSDDGTPRVLQVVGAMNMGGAETMLMNLYRALDRRLVQFDFLVFDNEVGAFDQEIRNLGGRIIRADAPGRVGYRRSIRCLEKVMNREGPYVAVHSHVLHASGIVLRAARRAHIDIRVAHSHNTSDIDAGWKRRLYQKLSRGMIRRSATVLVACGEEAGRYLFGSRWSREGLTIRNSIDVAKFATVPHQVVSELRDQWSASSGTVVLGSVARMEPVKNHSFLLEVLDRCRQARLDVQLVLVGDGSLRRDLEMRVHAMGLARSVRFLGVCEDVAPLMASFDLFLMPSHYEGMPVALVEAQAAGTPCLVSQAITREIDLGLGLVTFGPLEPDRWVDLLLSCSSASRPDVGEIRDALSRQGYDVSSALPDVYGLYGLRT